MTQTITVQGYIITYLEGTKYHLNIVWEQGNDAMTVDKVFPTLEKALAYYEDMKANPRKLPKKNLD